MGFIKIDRNVINTPLFKDERLLRMMIYCRCKAYYQDETLNGISIPRGSFPTSVAILSRETGYSTQSIKTLLAKLTTMNEISKTTQRSGTIIQVMNYEVAQAVRLESDGAVDDSNGTECSPTISTSHLANEPTNNRTAFAPRNTTISSTQSPQTNKRLNSDFNRPEQQYIKNICKEKEKKNELINPPSFTDVAEYARSMGYKFDIQYFYRYCESKQWKTAYGTPIVDWKRYVDKWSEKNPETRDKTIRNHKETDLSALDFSRFTVKGG